MTTDEMIAIWEHVAKRIRERRRELDMTQANLAEKLGISRQVMNRYELGKVRIGTDQLVVIARALQVPVGYFFVGLEQGSSPAPQID